MLDYVNLEIESLYNNKLCKLCVLGAELNLI
jgi:hypothetical protein